MSLTRKILEAVDAVPEAPSELMTDVEQAFGKVMAALGEKPDAGCGELADWMTSELRVMGYGYHDAFHAGEGHSFAVVDREWIVDVWEPDGSLKLKVFHYTDPVIQRDKDYAWPGKEQGALPDTDDGSW